MSGGTWYYGISNEGSTTITFTNQIFFGYNYTPNLVQTFTNTTMVALTTDGTTNSSQICYTYNGQQVLDFSVGVRLADPNLDDLVLRLTSPQGSSVVLFENRGGLLASNLGLTLTNGDAHQLHLHHVHRRHQPGQCADQIRAAALRRALQQCVNGPGLQQLRGCSPEASIPTGRAWMGGWWPTTR